MTTIITRADIVAGHDGRAEIEVELTYTNGGTATICLDEEACLQSLDRSGIATLEDLVGRPWDVVLPALQHRNNLTETTSPKQTTATQPD
jgi:hypothetical protein